MGRPGGPSRSPGYDAGPRNPKNRRASKIPGRLATRSSIVRGGRPGADGGPGAPGPREVRPASTDSHRDPTTESPTMPATLRQIRANRRNALLSTGPSPEGREKSRRNALKHGLAGRGVVLPEGQYEAVLERAAQWHSSLRPVDVYEEWLLESAAGESLRYERCNAEEAALRGRLVERAWSSWDEDRATEAEQTARSLARDPALTVRKLRRTSQGAALLLG